MVNDPSCGTTSKIDLEVKSGDLAYVLNRPYNYALFQYATYLGNAFLILPVNFAIVAGLALLLAGPPQLALLAWPGGRGRGDPRDQPECCAIFVAYHVLVGSAALWMGNSEVFSNQASGALINLSTYPGSIFRGWIKVVTLFVIPAAMLGHLLVEVIRHFDPFAFAAVIAFSVAMSVVSVVVFRVGLRRYESGSLVALRG